MVFVCFIFVFLYTLSYGKKGKGKISLLVGFAVGFFISYVDMPNIVERFMIWFVFFVFGRYAAYEEKLKYCIETKSHRLWMLFVLLFVLLSGVYLCLMHSNCGLNAYMLIFARKVFKYALGFLGVLLLYIFACFAEKNIKRFSDVLKCVGDYSYDIYLMHNPYIVALCCVVLGSFAGVNAVATVVISAALGIAVPMAVSKLIIRKFKYLSAIMLGR